jgi:hypothetical protein
MSVIIRFGLIAAVAIGIMLVIRDGRVVRHFGLVARCETISAPLGEKGTWKECEPGRIDGRRDLTDDGCKLVRTQGTIDIWQCLDE